MMLSVKNISALLDYLGCRFTLAGNGFEVMAALEAERYDCILMDKNMPGQDGIVTTRMIRESEKKSGKHLPIIALTASAVVGECEKTPCRGDGLLFDQTAAGE